MKPKRVMITPYLHDTRIYLNRIKINTKYFYTSIESKTTDGTNKLRDMALMSLPSEGSVSSLLGDNDEDDDEEKDVSIKFIGSPETKL